MEDYQKRILVEFGLGQILYRYQTLEAHGTGWVGILLIILFNILFLVAAFIKFNKYDLR